MVPRAPGYAGDMSEHAPDLGRPTDAAIGEETAALLLSGERDAVRRRHGDPAGDAEQTLETPDALGGTGGPQEGGAG